MITAEEARKMIDTTKIERKREKEYLSLMADIETEIKRAAKKGLSYIKINDYRMSNKVVDKLKEVGYVVRKCGEYNQYVEIVW